MDWGGDYEKDRVRVRNVWDSQFLNTILTIITLAIVDLFFTVGKVARGGCTFGTLSTFFLQLGEGLKSTNTKRNANGVGQLTCSSCPTTSVDPTTPPPPP